MGTIRVVPGGYNSNCTLQNAIVTKDRGGRNGIRGNLRSKENARVKKRLAPLGRVRTRP